MSTCFGPTHHSQVPLQLPASQTCLSPPIPEQLANQAFILPPAQYLHAEGQALPALTFYCLHLLCLRAGLPIRLVLLGQCHHGSLSPHPVVLGTGCWLLWLLRALMLCFQPPSHHGTRDSGTKSSQAPAVIPQHRSADLHFQKCSLFGVCVSSRCWAVQQL